MDNPKDRNWLLLISFFYFCISGVSDSTHKKKFSAKISLANMNKFAI